MGNEPSKEKLEGAHQDHRHWKHYSTSPKLNVIETGSTRSDSSSIHSGYMTHRTDTISSGNSGDSDSKLKKKRGPLKSAKDFLFTTNKPSRQQNRPLYKSDVASSNSSIVHNLSKEESLDGVRTSVSSVSGTYLSNEKNGDAEDTTYMAERGCSAGHDLMNQMFNVEAYQAVFNRLYLAPIETYLRNGAQVLQVGCGPAEWSIEMAKKYPDVQFHAVDTSNYAPTPKQQRHNPKNVNISVIRDLKSLDYDDQTFDYVVCRFQSFRIGDWRSHVNELVRVTKPGWSTTHKSYVELCEPDMSCSGAAGPACTELSNSLAKMMLSYDRDPVVSERLESLLSQTESLLFVNSQASFVNLTSSEVAYNVYFLTVTRLGKYLPDWKPPHVELDTLIAQYVRECLEGDCHMGIRSAFAQRSRLI
ncbi:hypothetical protein NQZ79_g4638 [Umbelopsis isabellina]|nr:hypothetical protein NQZ79_g4638 [Umbelopsis isabellina]